MSITGLSPHSDTVYTSHSIIDKLLNEIGLNDGASPANLGPIYHNQGESVSSTLGPRASNSAARSPRALSV